MGAEMRRCCLSFPVRTGTVLKRCDSDALRALTVPASLRWNQLMMGLLPRREIFFTVSCEGGTTAGLVDIVDGVVESLESFFDLTVDAGVVVGCC